MVYFLEHAGNTFMNLVNSPEKAQVAFGVSPMAKTGGSDKKERKMKQPTPNQKNKTQLSFTIEPSMFQK